MNKKVEWEKTRADNIFYPISVKNKSNLNLEVLSVTQDQGVIKRKDLSFDLKYDESSINTYKIVKSGQFIISLRSFQGGIELSEIDGLVSPAYTIFESKKNIYPHFFKYLFKSPRFINKLNGLIYGIRDGKQISFSDFSTMILDIPPLNEQISIANILKLWDEAINILSTKITHEKTRKKSITSKIYRGDLSHSNVSKENYKKIGLYVEEKNIRNNGLSEAVLSVSNSKGFIPQDEQFDHVVASKDKNKYKIVNRGEFAYNPSRVNVGSIDLLTTLDIGILSPMYVVFKCNSDLNNRYLYHFLKSDLFLQLIPKYTQGSVRDSLSFDGLCSMKLYIPTLEEQLVYAQALDSIDDYIKKLEQLLELYKLQKKGLMQQLLTGKIRVNVN
jgi:type I restriction enzyme S subunit